MSALGTTFGIAVGIYVLLGLTMFGLQRNFLYFPDKERPDPDEAGVEGLRVVALESEPGVRVRHWYVPPPNDTAPVVVVFHGNAGHIGHRVPKFRALLKAGFGLFLAEYRGYGGNPGSPDEPGMTADAEAVMAFLAAEGIGPKRLVVYGESLGSGVAVKMAAAHESAGVVLESPFTSVGDVAQAHYWFLPARWLVLDTWEVAGRIDEIGAPLLVLHGELDRIVPVRFGREVFARAREPKQAVFHPEAGHNDLFLVPEVVDAVIAFVRAHAAGAPVAADPTMVAD